LTGHVLGSAGYQTLTAGVYDFTAAAQLTGTLTLSGPGDFVFRIGSSFGTSSNAEVLVTNGADAGNVYWQVGSSVALNTGTAFKGNILTNSSIVLNDGTLDGRALAGSSVTIIGETITTIPEPTTICLLGLGALSLIRRKKS
jgi:type VI secretion system secreted protein VgrG